MATIKISKDYVETLIRRAELHHTSDDDVTIPRAEYQALLQFRQNYQSLRAALLAGGATDDTLDVLISAPSHALKQPSGHPWSADAPLFIPAVAQSFQKCRVRASSSGNWPNDPSPISVSPESFGFEDEESSATLSDQGENATLNCGRNQETQLGENEFDSSYEDRTLFLTGLSNGTTLADITKAICGGQILNLYVKEQERTAHISFVNSLDAKAFLMYTKRADLYIRGKRVKVSLAERQRFMPGHVEHKIVRFGASRNLVIQFPKSDMTPDSIRGDLEHIHNLKVVDVKTLAGGHLLISTNDISLAVTARTCMASRLRYKGARIEFYPDECSAPLPPVLPKKVQPAGSPPQKIVNTNRFHMLTTGEEDDIC